MSQKKNFSQTEITRFWPGLRSAKSFSKLPSKDVISATAAWTQKRMRKKESCALGKQRTQKRLNCNRSPKLRREKTGRWSSQHGEEIKTEKILKGEQSNIFACFLFGKQTFSRAPLKNWQRLSNFWQILTSLEKLKYVATTSHKRSTEKLNLTTAISMIRQVLFQFSCWWEEFSRESCMRWYELSKRWRWKILQDTAVNSITGTFLVRFKRIHLWQRKN